MDDHPHEAAQLVEPAVGVRDFFQRHPEVIGGVDLVTALLDVDIERDGRPGYQPKERDASSLNGLAETLSGSSCRAERNDRN